MRVRRIYVVACFVLGAWGRGARGWGVARPFEYQRSEACARKKLPIASRASPFSSVNRGSGRPFMSILRSVIHVRCMHASSGMFWETCISIKCFDNRNNKYVRRGLGGRYNVDGLWFNAQCRI